MSHAAHSPGFDVAQVGGDASDEVKTFAERLLRDALVDPTHGFAYVLGQRLRVVEVSVGPSPHAGHRREASVVLEVDAVEDDMVNPGENLHGACSAYLIDICTSLPLGVLLGASPGVSQSITMVYHAPAPRGVPLKIVTSSISLGSRTMAARGEIWDKKHSRLIASGVHTKMIASKPKL